MAHQPVAHQPDGLISFNPLLQMTDVWFSQAHYLKSSTLNLPPSRWNSFATYRLVHDLATCYVSTFSQEKAINKAIESGTTQAVPDFPGLKKRYQMSAKYTLEKSKNINIRLSEKDLYKLKAKAAIFFTPFK